MPISPFNVDPEFRIVAMHIPHLLKGLSTAHRATPQKHEMNTSPSTAPYVTGLTIIKNDARYHHSVASHESIMHFVKRPRTINRNSAE